MKANRHYQAMTVVTAITTAAAAGVAMPAWGMPLTEDVEASLVIGALSDYRTGGISQTLGDPALQFDASLTHSSGFYAGVFTSNVDFGTATHREYDYYVGYSTRFNEVAGMSLTYFEYDYPKNSEYNYGEWVGTVDAYGVELGMKYTSEVKPFDDDHAVYWAKYTFELPQGFSLDARYGYSDAKDDIWVSGSGTTRSAYRDWEVGINREAIGVEWRLSYIDTDLSRAECASVNTYKDVCSAALVASATKTF